MKICSITLLVIALLSSTVSAQVTRRDGNWWRDRLSVERNAFVIGIFDGIQLGHRFSYWGSTENKKLEEFLKLDSFEEFLSKYMKNVRSDQLVDGLNGFYNDYQNRRILVIDGVWLVLNGIAGTPKEDLDKMIEGYRRNAGQ